VELEELIEECVADDLKIFELEREKEFIKIAKNVEKE
jgi:hypothetical protein